MMTLYRGSNRLGSCLLQLISDGNERLDYPTMCLGDLEFSYYISLVDLWTVPSVKVLNSRWLRSGLVAAAVVF
jgi:hypothetical protein